MGPPGTRGWEGQWDRGASGGTRESQGLPMVPLGLGDFLAGLGIVMATPTMEVERREEPTEIGEERATRLLQ